MNSETKKIREVTKLALNLITDIRERYVKMYDLPANEWDNSLRQLYFLNCDTEITSLLERNEIEPNIASTQFGLCYGILILKNEIISNYNKKYGDLVDDIQIKDTMFEDINTAAVDFLMYGV